MRGSGLIIVLGKASDGALVEDEREMIEMRGEEKEG